MKSFVPLPIIPWVWGIPGLFTLVSWGASLIGPRSLFWFGLLGFLGGAAALLLAPRRARVRPHPLEPSVSLVRCESFLGMLILISIVVMFATCRLDGVADFPALGWRPVYELNNHGQHHVVTRFRFALASSSFSTGWHGMALLTNVEAFRKRFNVHGG
jgi:hypothetical protein